MARRLFLAVPLPEKIAAEVSELCVDLSQDCTSARWTRKENLHVTVLFLGDVEDTECEELLPKLEEAFVHSHSLELSITGLVAGPPSRPPSMLWLQFKPSVGFAAVATAARQAVANIIDLKPAHDKPLPHVTLARFRSGVPAPCQNRVKSIEYRQTFATDCVVLFESRLSQDGPTYCELRSFGLGPKNNPFTI